MKEGHRHGQELESPKGRMAGSSAGFLLRTGDPDKHLLRTFLLAICSGVLETSH